MPKQSGASMAAPKKTGRRAAAIGAAATIRREATTGQFTAVYPTKVEAVMAAAQRSGLMRDKDGRIGGRISAALVRQAKAQTGIDTDSDLIAFALANVALEDRFAESFKAVRGTVDPDLKLGF